MKKIIFPFVLFILFFIVIVYAQETVISRVTIECYNTSLLLTTNKNTYTPPETANMTVYIHHNSSFPLNATLIIDLVDSIGNTVKTMVNDDIYTAAYSWYNYSYYNDFEGVLPGDYIMRSRLFYFQEEDNQIIDCSGNKIEYNKSITIISIPPGVVVPGFPPLEIENVTPSLDVSCPPRVELEEPMGVNYNINNPTEKIQQTVLYTILSKENIAYKSVKKIVTLNPKSSYSWTENMGLATCSLPQGLYNVIVVWKKIDGRQIKVESLLCFEIPECKKVKIINVTHQYFYINETVILGVRVKNLGNVNVSNLLLDISIESFLAKVHQEKFLINFLLPDQTYTVYLFKELKPGPYVVNVGLIEKSEIIDSKKVSFIIPPRIEIIDLILIIIILLLVAYVIRRYIKRYLMERRRKRVIKLIKRRK
ncbi:MAG: hypothetical protein ACE5J4_00880 [Candidatus Aenigmatarchaeota archaeon]